MGVKLGLTLMEDIRLRVFESRMLRKVFGPRLEVTRDRRRLHKEFHDLHCSLNIIRAIK
jgi:hypothetical protein